MTEAKVNWYGDKVRLVIGRHVQQSLENVAFRIEERTKIGINQAPGASGQGLIDTGFMLNSTYVATPDQSTYGEADPTGFYTDREGREVERRLAPEVPLPKGAAALVAVGADYAIFQEIEHAFFFEAIEDTATELGGLIEKF